MRAASTPLLLALSLGPLGCWSAATKTFDTGADRALDAGEADSGGAGGTGSGRSDTGDTGPAGDLDGDGYTVEEGDCDDGDDRISPGAVDDCDGWDEDCDGIVDEDAAADDSYEPNDGYDEAADLGSLEDAPERSLAAYLHNADDVDRYLVSIDDGWLDFFSLSVALSEIPDGATYQVSLTFRGPDGDLELASDYGSGALSLTAEEGFGVDESGDYEIRVEALSEPDCGRAYQLSIALDQWI